jgi:integrase
MSIKTHRGKLVVDLVDPVSRRRVRVRVPDSETSDRRAAAFERKVRAQLAAGTLERRAAPACPTLAEFWPRVVAYCCSPANRRPWRPRTLQTNEAIYRTCLEIEIGGTRLDSITTQVVDTLAAGLAGKRGLRPNTVANALGLLRRVLSVAKRWGLLPGPLPEIHATKRRADRIEDAQWLTTAEAAALVAHIGERWRPLIVLALRTGLRMGELQALRWSDVDAAARVVHVRRSWSDRTGEFGPPKSGRARTIPLTPDAADMLTAQRFDNGSTTSQSLVFGTARGSVPFHRNALLRALVKASAACGKHLHPHMLRHTFASHAIAAGVPTRILMVWGGWESEAMLARYGHLAPTAGDAWIGRLAEHGTIAVPSEPPTQNAVPDSPERRSKVAGTGFEPVRAGKQKSC